MKNLSIFSLIRISNDEKAKNELLKRFNLYKNNSFEISLKLAKEFIDKLENIVYQKEEFELSNLEELSQYFSINDAEKYKERLIALVHNENYIDFASYCLKESMTFCFTYLILILCGYLTYNKKKKEFNQILKYYTTSIFFSYIALNLLKDSIDYPYLYHESYYTFNKDKDLIDFYLDYPNNDIPSLIYKLLKDPSIEIAHHTLAKKSFDNSSKSRFINLIKKHNNTLQTHKEIKSLIRDFDNFFTNEYDIMTAVNIFKDEAKDDLDSYPNIIEFIFTLFTRCNNYHTLAFSICCLDFIVYRKDFRRLYKTLESLAHFEALTPYCLFALQKLPNFQPILRRLLKCDSIYIKLPILDYLDIKDDSNFKILIDNIEHQHFYNIYLDNILTYCDFNEKLTNENLTIEEINRISKFICYYNFYSQSLNILNYTNIHSLLITFINNHYERIINKHFFNVSILDMFDDNNDKKSKELCSLILKNINYEDELNYIDEQFENKNINLEEIAVLLSYYKYDKDEEILNLLNEDINKYTNLISSLNDERNIIKALEILDKKFIIPKTHLIINKFPIDYSTNKTSNESISLFFIYSALNKIPLYYHNLYKYGINYFEENIRYLFYENLQTILEVAPIDEEMINNLEINYQNETNKKNKETLEKIIQFKKINIS